MNRKVRRETRRKIRRLSERLRRMEGGSFTEYQQIKDIIDRCSLNDAIFETERLTEKASKRGVDVPNDKDGWWRETGAAIDGAPLMVLTDNGKAGVRRLIRAERLKTTEQWVRIIIPILALIVAILALLNK